MSYAQSMVMTKRSGRDRRVSVYFAPSKGERRAYQDRRAEPAAKDVGEPPGTEASESPTIEAERGSTIKSRNVAIVVLILAAVLIVSL